MRIGERLRSLIGFKAPIRVTLDAGAIMPERAHPTDAGADLRSREFAMLYPGEKKVFDTGVHVRLPKGTVGLLLSKSRLMAKGIITVGGVIDEGYTGSIRVILENTDHETVHPIRVGDKITQLVILPVRYDYFQRVKTLRNTERGSNGFGSTGR